MPTDHTNVLIVGAGLSGIATAYYLQKRCPHKSYRILEARDTLGGTWDLFRYPGIRSDVDMHAYGYSFRPWTDDKVIADGDSILNYLRETSAAYDIDRHIHYQHRVCRVSWSSDDARWTVDVAVGSDTRQMTCDFLHFCSGYYDYDEGHAPTWEGQADFAGRIIHPQHWPDDLNYTSQHVLVIGSGATAVTLIPAMAEQAAHITMLQRSPSYISSRPADSPLAANLRRFLPANFVHHIARWKGVLTLMFLYNFARRFPETAKKELITYVREELGDDFDVDTHFTPSYDPWDQRVCVTPDSDFFKAIKAGQVSVVTDEIETFTESGIRLKSGEDLQADLIITATGLKVKMLNNIQVIVDDEIIHIGDTIAYKGVMSSNVPNFVSTFGYVNASWTLKSELVAAYVCRLLNHMDRHDYAVCIPVLDTANAERQPPVDFNPGYILRALDNLPKQSTRRPWKVYQNYIMDWLYLRASRLEDGVLQFTPRQQTTVQARREANPS